MLSEWIDHDLPTRTAQAVTEHVRRCARCSGLAIALRVVAAGKSAVGTWLYRITLNRCLGERRKRKPEPIEAEPLDLLRRWEDPDYTVDPAVVAGRRADASVLHAVLDTLPETYRVALILHDAQGLSASELADAMDIPLGTAKSHIRRGRMALVSRLAEDDLGLLEGVR